MQSIMADSEIVSLIGNCIGLLGVAVCSVSALRSTARRMRRTKSARNKRVTQIYEDRDGQASLSSMDSFIDRLPREISAVLTLIGTMVTLARAMLTTNKPDTPFMIEQWLQFSAWVCDV